MGNRHGVGYERSGTREHSFASLYRLRQSSFRRIRRWASRLSFRSHSGRAAGCAMTTDGVIDADELVSGANETQMSTTPPHPEQGFVQLQQQQQIVLQPMLHDAPPAVSAVATEQSASAAELADRWNRGSRRRIQRSTLGDPFGGSKSKWPVPFIESLFLPEFPVRPGPHELGDLEVLDVIAAGAFGNVLKVRSEDDKQLYALKVIDKARLLTQGHGVVHQSKDEVGVQLAVGHSAFVAALQCHWQTRKRLYLLLQFLPNGELFADWRRHGRYSEQLARFYTAELACCLDFLHSRGVIFRDLKLENVVLDAAGHLVLVDFGLCKWLRRGQITRTICGTLTYAAPEMLNGQPYDHSVDWWSLGILFYALVCGKFPLHGARSHRQMAQMIRGHEYETPSRLSWQCRYTIDQLLQKNPRRRLASLADLAQSPFYRDSESATSTSNGIIGSGVSLFEAVAARRLDPDAFATDDDRRLRYAPAKATSRANPQPASGGDDQQRRRRRRRRSKKEKQRQGGNRVDENGVNGSSDSSSSDASETNDAGSSFASTRLPAAYRQSQL